jgi:signal transduction histidine kinase
MAIPLRARGSLIGFIALDSRNSGQYQESDALLALSYSNQVAIALENARLFSDLQTELWKRRKLIEELETKNIESETLRESVAIVAATLDRDDAIDLILEQLERVVPYDSASVQLVSGNMLEIVSSKGYPIGDDKADNTFEINEDEPAYLVLRNEKPYVLFDDIQPLFPAFQEPPHNRIHAWMAVPLVVKGRVLGIIALDGYQKEKFTERHAQLAMTYASQVAIALDNARLFSDLQSELAFRQNLISELEAKNAELERFTYTVSHDLKSPLFTIRGFLGYLEEDAMAGNYERMKSDIQRITDATNKMQQLLNELLELSRVGRITNESETIPFEELTREAVELVQGHIMEHGVSVHIDADMPDVFGDRQRLREVVQNLVDNAAKFMGDQLEPRIEIGQDGEEDGMPIFHVRDNGIGIPTEHHERVFGLFNKLDVRSDGTGIGLALVKRIIEYHGGRIWVESGMGLGTTFYFTLPAG